MGSRVLLQVIFTAESFAAKQAAVRSNAGVNSLVSGKLLVSGERLFAGLKVALERPLAWNDVDWDVARLSIYEKEEPNWNVFNGKTVFLRIILP